jgi:hypothetical protein
MSVARGIPVAKFENGRGEREPDLQSQSGPPGSLPTPLSGQKHGFAKAGKQVSYEPVEPSAEDWENQDPEIIKKNYAQIEEVFRFILDEYENGANEAGKRYTLHSQRYKCLRYLTIAVATLIAVMNLFSTSNDSWSWGPISLSKLSALLAILLAAVGSVEAFSNSAAKATRYREIRDLLINQYREYHFKWSYYVEPYGRETPRACRNAGQLYGDLVNSDQELRLKIRQLTEQPLEKPK